MGTSLRGMMACKAARMASISTKLSVVEASLKSQSQLPCPPSRLSASSFSDSAWADFLALRLSATSSNSNRGDGGGQSVWTGKTMRLA